MSLDNRLESLKTQHAELEQALETWIQTPASTDDDFATIKKQKLALKDEINKLEQEVAH